MAISLNDILLHAARGECLTGGNKSEFDLWIERYAELLGCDNRAGAVSVAIEALIAERDESEQYKRKYYGLVRRIDR